MADYFTRATKGKEAPARRWKARIDRLSERVVRVCGCVKATDEPPGIAGSVRGGSNMADTINRYILRQLLLVTIFVTVALTLAIWLTQSLRLIRCFG